MAYRSRAHGAGVGLAAIFLVIGGPAYAPSCARAGEAEETSEIAWRGDYSRAFDEARAREQLLWIQFTGPWCPNCTRMEQDTFPDPAVKERARSSFVAVRLRADVDEQLALGFGLTGLPATVVVSPSRDVLAVRQGYLGPRELDALLADALERRRAKLEAARRLVSNDPRTQSSAGAKPAAGRSEGPSRPRDSAPKNDERLALSGYCPVSLVSDKKLITGQTEYAVVHEGRLYRFANLLTFNLFRRDPGRYIPVNGGNCPVSELDRHATQPGSPRHGVLFQGRLFLCSSEADRRAFLAQPEKYAAIDVAERGYCPHCLSQQGLLVRGDPRVELNREGKRYWFPDASHREAFVATASASSGTERR
ncbi:Thiol:disulfide interchange protein DsbD [Aquisphaera giovannonii]|uniref:Thiol:disulfide interchange protein DsbD n=1 Tax=Aquisphaera giovannonii TaxID=406548 RepID=A0A5B9VY12_9BACT|nr:thioredoxin family protein [Aquisphaera giovannonii]QEH32877.1 Thiol:disulfide interchange protein DsbD [Aquisphaera giovannonii]